MQHGDIVTVKQQDYPSCLEGTPDGRIFYKISGKDTRGNILIKTLYVGGWHRGKEKRMRGHISESPTCMMVEEEQFRLATSEERVQLALAMFME